MGVLEVLFLFLPMIASLAALYMFDEIFQVPTDFALIV